MITPAWGIWVVIIAAGVLTYGLRLSFLVLFKHIQLPTYTRKALRFVPVTILPAIIAQEVLLSNGTLDISLSNGRLIAGLVAIGVAWRTRSVFLTIVIGMATFLLFSLWFQP